MKRTLLLTAAALLGIMACTTGSASPSGTANPSDSASPISSIGPADGAGIDDPNAPQGKLGGSSRPAPGPGISIDDAIALGSDELVLVNGSLVIANGETRLCSGLRESYPRQCGGSWLVVVGLEPGSIDLTEASGVGWTEDIQLLGIVSGEVLTIPTGTP